MAMARCPHCDLMLTRDEAQAPRCPACKGLLARAVPGVQAPPEPAPAPPRAGAGRGILLSGAVAVLVLGGLWAVYALWPPSPPAAGHPDDKPVNVSDKSK